MQKWLHTFPFVPFHLHFVTFHTLCLQRGLCWGCMFLSHVKWANMRKAAKSVMGNSTLTSAQRVCVIIIFYMMNSLLNGPISVRKKPVIERSHLKWFAVLNNRPSDKWGTVRFVLADTFTNLALPPLLSIPSSLECHYSVGGFNIAFNPHRLIITLTFTLHSIKFLTADLLQWLFCIAEGSSNYAAY